MKILDPYLKKSNLINKDIKKMFVKNFNQKLDCLIITVSHNLFLRLKKIIFKSFKKKESFSMLKIFLKIKVFKFKNFNFLMLCIIQARCGSKRLRRKIFKKLRT